jgi:hypothetical protein
VKLTRKLPPGLLSLVIALLIIAGGMTLPRWLLQRQMARFYAAEHSISQTSISPYGSNQEALRKRLGELLSVLEPQTGIDSYLDSSDSRDPLSSELSAEDANLKARQFLGSLSSNLYDALDVFPSFELVDYSLHVSPEDSSLAMWYLSYQNGQGNLWQVVLDSVSGIPLWFNLTLADARSITETEIRNALWETYRYQDDMIFTLTSEDTKKKDTLSSYAPTTNKSYTQSVADKAAVFTAENKAKAFVETEDSGEVLSYSSSFVGTCELLDVNLTCTMQFSNDELYYLQIFLWKE